MTSECGPRRPNLNGTKVRCCYDVACQVGHYSLRRLGHFLTLINVIPTLWINVEIMSIWCWKWNKMRRRIFNVAQRWYNVSAQSRSNIDTTLHNVETILHNIGTMLIQRCFNLASTLVKPLLNPIDLVMIVDCVIVIYFKYMNSFYFALWESIFLLYINNWTTNEISKNFLTVVHIVIHNVGNNGDIHRALKCCIQNGKNSLKNIKI